ncbi:MAG: NHL repeat-containing protein [Planctomycetes bacterium]|nr:NHL repeat-containing protein [Planctomycetota bacterium]
MLRLRSFITVSTSALLLASSLTSSLDAQEFVANRLFVVSGNDARLYGYGGNEPIVDEFGEAHTTGAFAVDAGLGFLLGETASSGEVAFAPDGTLYVTALPTAKVHVFDTHGNLVRQLGEGLTNFFPVSLAFGPDGEVYVGSSVGDEPIHVFDHDGQLVRKYGPVGGVNITGLAFDQGSHLFASCHLVDVVKELDPSGKLVRNIGVGVLSDPRGLAFGPDGLLYVASSGSDRVIAFDQHGAVVKQLGVGVLDKPVAVTFGPDGRLYVSSHSSNAVVRFDTLDESSETLSFGTGELRGPLGLTFVPTRIATKLRGLLGQDGVPLANERETAVLSIPSSGPRLMIEFADTSGTLTASFGSPWAVFQGFQSFDQTDDTIRMEYGVQIASEPSVDGTASLAAALRGRLRPDGVWMAMRAVGTVHLATPQTIWNARLTSGRVLND